MPRTCSVSIWLVLAIVCLPFGIKAQEVVIENDTVRYSVGADGQNVSLVDKASQKNLLATTSWACASILQGGQRYPASQVTLQNGNWLIAFGASGVNVVLHPHAEKSFLSVEVVSVEGKEVEELTFLNIPVQENVPLAACTLALNLKTNVPELPGPMQRLNAIAYKRFGFEGAKVALLVTPSESLREIMKTVVKSSDQIPRSMLGGPWALEAPITRGSYFIDIDAKLGEDTVDAWIKLAKDMGVGQIDFHTGKTMRFGDLLPDPKHYPHGFDGVKSVVDKLHAAGIKAGLHTYAFYIAKDSEWVSPKPDARLAKARIFTLAQDLSTEAHSIPLLESPKGLTSVTGFQVRNSATIQIDDELITFEGVSADAPFAFTGCKRGAWGTKPANHAKNAQVAHLKECFGLFAPDGDSTLYTEVAARTAEVYNRCGFDMIYLDALDGVDLIAGPQNGWHYAAKFVFEMNKRLERPALFEMSMFDHLLWYARSRMGAWDVPARAFKHYVDIHSLANEDCTRMFMPAHLGWWGAFDWAPVQPERTFSDDMEYACGKSIGYDSSLSFLVGFTPEIWAKSSNARRLGGIVKQYESLRLLGTVPESTKAALRVRGDEFELVQESQKNAVFQRIQYTKHVVEGGDTATWTVPNHFAQQEPGIRIEALMSAAPYDAPDAIPLSDFTKAEEFTEKKAQDGIILSCAPATQPQKDGLPSMAFDAKSQHPESASAWGLRGKIFPELLDLTDRALGVWVYGDGQGEILNIQLQNPAHINSAISEHYITVDFTGWRYCLLIEPESDRIGHYGWPYSPLQDLKSGKKTPFGGVILDYNVWVDYGHIGALNIYLNHLPINKDVRCVLSPIRALPLKPIEIVNPRITISGKTIMFPITLKSGQYIEFRSKTSCIAYDVNGEPIGPVSPVGEIPMIEAGDNQIQFASQETSGMPPVRARVTLIVSGETIPAQ